MAVKGNARNGGEISKFDFENYIYITLVSVRTGYKMREGKHAIFCDILFGAMGEEVRCREGRESGPLFEGGIGGAFIAV